MSETTSTDSQPAPITIRGTPETLQSQTFIVTGGLWLTLNGALFAIFLTHDLTAFQAGVGSSVVTGILGFLGGFYYSASKHPTTDAPPTTTTTKAPDTTTVTQTGTAG